MTARAAAVADLIRAALAAADRLIGTLVSHLRAARPEAVSLMTLGLPTEPIRDSERGGR